VEADLPKRTPAQEVERAEENSLISLQMRFQNYRELVTEKIAPAYFEVLPDEKRLKQKENFLSAKSLSD